MVKTKSVAFHTLGCKLNFAETSTIARDFISSGYRKVDFNSSSDFYILNTCSVTENADKECHQLVRKVKKINPESKVIIIGCYAQLKPEKIKSIKGVDIVLGANDKFNVKNYLNSDDILSRKSQPCDINKIQTYQTAFSSEERTRAFLKIQDGCDYKCTFCTIPLARGKSRSSSIENVINKANYLASKGVKEIVLTGVNIGDFGKGLSKNNAQNNFLDLIKALDLEQNNIQRFRISSIEPNLLSAEIIQLVSESKKFVPHFHVPLQSGSNEILKKMKRRYQKSLYAERVNLIKLYMPEASIGVDVIVGFPGETDELFNETVDFLKSLEVSYFHVFSYSRRENTIANEMENQVPKSVIKQRSKILRMLSEKKKRLFYSKFLKTSRKVLFEDKVNNNLIEGYTDNYIRVAINNQNEVSNELVDTQLENINDRGVVQGINKERTNVLL